MRWCCGWPGRSPPAWSAPCSRRARPWQGRRAAETRHEALEPRAGRLLDRQQPLQVLLLDVDALDIGLIGLLGDDQIDELGRQIHVRAFKRPRFELPETGGCR